MYLALKHTSSRHPTFSIPRLPTFLVQDFFGYFGTLCCFLSAILLEDVIALKSNNSVIALKSNNSRRPLLSRTPCVLRRAHHMTSSPNVFIGSNDTREPLLYEHLRVTVLIQFVFEDPHAQNNRGRCLPHPAPHLCCGVVPFVAVWCSVVQCDAVRCSLLQCVAVCCSVLQCVTTAPRATAVLQCVAVCCSVLQYGAVRCSALLCVAVCCSGRRTARHTCVVVWCSVVQCGAVWCSVVQCGAVRCSELQ